MGLDYLFCLAILAYVAWKIIKSFPVLEAIFWFLAISLLLWMSSEHMPFWACMLISASLPFLFFLMPKKWRDRYKEENPA